MQKQGLKYLFIILILIDLSFSFLQHYNKPLDGDMPGGIVPAEDVKKVLSDPFGMSVILNDEFYPNPNRFFSHWAFQNYFTTAPEWIQKISSPVESIYLSAALIKTTIQLALMVLLGYFISKKLSIRSFDFILAILLITPLFQINGWKESMGIIDSSITYTFFYALPIVFLLLFYLPFYKLIFLKEELKNENKIFFIGILLSLFISFSSPLIPGIVLIVSVLLVTKWFFNINRELGNAYIQLRNIIFTNKKWIFLFLFVNFSSLYSLYIGMNNSIFYDNDLPISERYERLPIGLFQILTEKISWNILLTIIVLNIFLLKRGRIEMATKYLLFYKGIFIFSIIYLALLPLGGYKIYRPFIIRYDTFIPVTIGLFYIFGSSTFLLLNTLIAERNKLINAQVKNIYYLIIAGVLFIFTISDKADFGQNDCEKTALKKISNSNEEIVEISCNCTIISWEIINHSNNSMQIGRLLLKWGITQELKTFTQVK